MTAIKCKILNVVSGKHTLLTMEIDGNLPFMNMTDLTINTHKIADNNISVNEPNNKLKALDGSNRYTFLFNGASGYSFIEYAVYFDTITEEIYIINNPDYIDVDTVENQHIVLYGYRVGTRDKIAGAGLTMVMKDADCKLPTPSGILTTVSIVQLNLHGINTVQTFSLSTTLDINKTGRMDINLNTFVKIDTNILFGININLPCNIIYPNTPGKFKNIYAGDVNKQYLYIPLPV